MRQGRSGGGGEAGKEWGGEVRQGRSGGGGEAGKEWGGR